MENQNAPRIEHLKQRILSIINRSIMLLKFLPQANEKQAKKIEKIILVSSFRTMFLKKDLELELAPKFPNGGLFNHQPRIFAKESVLPRDWNKTFRKELDAGKIDLFKMNEQQKDEFRNDLIGKAILNNSKIDFDKLRYFINNFPKK
jgi:hypothetical protein